MASMLDSVDQRTKLAGHNRLELLLFRLTGDQKFAINVFKVREIIQCPKLIQLPESHHTIKGVANLRGKAVPIIDLSMSIGQGAIDDIHNKFVVLTEYNRRTQGFLVEAVEQIINISWEDVFSPPMGATYLTAVIKGVDGELIEIADVEKVLSEIQGFDEEVSEELVETGHNLVADRHALIADDSFVARTQVKNVLDQIGLESTVVNDGKQAWEQLLTWLDEGMIGPYWPAIVISDIEMPQMDGYSLVSKIRSHEKLKHLHVVMHTSMSGEFNQSMIESVGADQFLAKFSANELAETVEDRLEEIAKIT
jgi:two-component system, chemotaxis family, chemotaxis protein CheV